MSYSVDTPPGESVPDPVLNVADRVSRIAANDIVNITKLGGPSYAIDFHLTDSDDPLTYSGIILKERPKGWVIDEGLFRLPPTAIGTTEMESRLWFEAHLDNMLGSVATTNYRGEGGPTHDMPHVDFSSNLPVEDAGLFIGKVEDMLDRYDRSDISASGGQQYAIDDMSLREDVEDTLWTEGFDAAVERVEYYDGYHVKSDDEYHYYGALDPETGETVVVEIDEENEYVETEPFDQWIYGSWTWDGMDDFLGYHHEDEWADTFWQTERTGRHATTPDSAAKIILSGELAARNRTRGINNTGVGNAVFASRNENLSEYYGEVVFEINFREMREDGFTPRVTQEPEIVDVKKRETIASMFYVDDFWPDYPHDVSADTVIIYDDIPLKYLSLESAPVGEIYDEIDELVGESVTESDAEEAREWVRENAPEELSMLFARGSSVSRGIEWARYRRPEMKADESDPLYDMIRGGYNNMADDRARDIVHDFLNTGMIPGYNQHEDEENDPPVLVDPFCDIEWGEPYEGHTNFEKGDTKWAIANACIETNDWLQLQYHQRLSSDLPYWEWKEGATDETVAWAVERIEAGETDEIPTPVLMFQGDGTLKRYQEGRSRGVAAEKAGLEWIPVVVMARNFR